jgi:hypothetical protein
VLFLHDDDDDFATAVVIAIIMIFVMVAIAASVMMMMVVFVMVAVTAAYLLQLVVAEFLVLWIVAHDSESFLVVVYIKCTTLFENVSFPPAFLPALERHCSIS